jgi:hypothetical protein
VSATNFGNSSFTPYSSIGGSASAGTTNIFGTEASNFFSSGTAGSMTSLPYADGGQVPLTMGTPGKDSVLAKLTPGEVVINTAAVNKYGADYFMKLNAQKFASGGLVGGGSSKNGEGTPYTLQIVNIADASSIPAQPVDAAQVINIVAFDAAKKGPTYKTIKGIMQGN